MIEIIKELDIEVSKPNVFQAVVAKQYDMNTRFIRATFVDGKEKITIDPAATVKVVINALRPDGESKGFEGEVNEDGTVTVPLHSWMLELDGTVVCDISVIDIESDDNKKLTTTSFTLLVEKAAFGGDDITTDPQFDVLVSLMDAAAVAQEALDKSNEALKLVADCEEATENANAVREEIEAGGYIESLKELNDGEKFSFWVGTHAEYSALTKKQPFTLYILTDETTEEDINAAFENLKTNIKETAEKIGLDINDIKKQISVESKQLFLSTLKFSPMGNMYVECPEIQNYKTIIVNISKDDTTVTRDIYLNLVGDTFECEDEPISYASGGMCGCFADISIQKSENGFVLRQCTFIDTEKTNAYLHRIVGIR